MSEESSSVTSSSSSSLSSSSSSSSSSTLSVSPSGRRRSSKMKHHHLVASSPSDNEGSDFSGGVTDDEPLIDPDEAAAEAAKEQASHRHISKKAASSIKPPKPICDSMDDIDPAMYFEAEWGGWTESDWTTIGVRGSNYLVDKIKVAAGPHMFRCEQLHVVNTGSERIYCCSERPNSYANQRYRRIIQERTEAAKANGGTVEESLSSTPADALNPLIVVNFIVPISATKNCNLLLYFTRRRHSVTSRPSFRETGADYRPSQSPDEPSPAFAAHTAANGRGEYADPDTNGTSDRRKGAWFDPKRLNAFDKLLMNFLDGDDNYRNRRLKVIPKVTDGGWVARKLVNGTPAILGQKITQYYFVNKTKNYCEIAVDLNSSVVAGKILQVVNGQAASLIVDLSFVFQGEDPAELPESLLCGVRLVHLKLDKFKDIGEVGI